MVLGGLDRTGVAPELFGDCLCTHAEGRIIKTTNARTAGRLQAPEFDMTMRANSGVVSGRFQRYLLGLQLTVRVSLKAKPLLLRRTSRPAQLNSDSVRLRLPSKKISGDPVN